MDRVKQLKNRVAQIYQQQQELRQEAKDSIRELQSICPHEEVVSSLDLGTKLCPRYDEMRLCTCCGLQEKPYSYYKWLPHAYRKVSRDEILSIREPLLAGTRVGIDADDKPVLAAPITLHSHQLEEISKAVHNVPIELNSAQRAAAERTLRNQRGVIQLLDEEMAKRFASHLGMSRFDIPPGWYTFVYDDEQECYCQGKGYYPSYDHALWEFHLAKGSSTDRNFQPGD